MQSLCESFQELRLLLTGLPDDFGEKKKFIKSGHNFENDILVASRNIAKRYSTAAKATSRVRRM